jgi:hypothetical protein
MQPGRQEIAPQNVTSIATTVPPSSHPRLPTMSTILRSLRNLGRIGLKVIELTAEELTLGIAPLTPMSRTMATRCKTLATQRPAHWLASTSTETSFSRTYRRNYRVSSPNLHYGKRGLGVGKSCSMIHVPIGDIAS